ncbi:MAG: 50S ribosomal protein L17 [bacterium]|nr:50S ribosomal protein L17 [bacterium]
MFSIKRKLHRTVGPRRNFVRILAHNLIMGGTIETTDARAKTIRPIMEKLVTIARRGRLQDLRLLLSRLPKDAASKLYYEIAPKYKERKGGYLRILKLGNMRRRDAAKTATISFV